MKFIILLLFLFFISSTYANDVYKLTLTQKDIEQIQQSSKKNFIIKKLIKILLQKKIFGKFYILTENSQFPICYILKRLNLKKLIID